MTEITIRIGYKWMLMHPRYSWNIINGAADSKEVMKYFLETVGNQIYNNVNEGSNFTLHVIGDNVSRSFQLKRLADASVSHTERDGIFTTFREEYCINLEMVSTGQKFSINQYVASGSSSSSPLTVLSGAGSAIRSFKDKFSDIIGATKKEIQDLKDALDLDKKLDKPTE